MTTRAQFDADRFEEIKTESSVKTAATPHEMLCEQCGRTAFVDADTHETFRRKAEQGISEGFLCRECVAANLEAERM
ncbi:MAG TPA: hypothetical protein DEP46_10285 [Blastocatellia bacterium]|nr:hypothetical protein [Blastocatellia bacterium]